MSSLLDQINADPAGPAAYEARDCHELARICSIGRTRIVKIPIASIQDVLHSSGAWWDIEAVADNMAHPAQKAARAVIDVAGARYDNIDTTIPRVGQMLGALVATGVMAQFVLDKIMAMAVAPDPLSAADMAEALYNRDGTPK